MWVRYAETRRLLAQIRDLKGQIVVLNGELHEERERSRRREDELLDRVLQASGRHSLTPAPKKAQIVEPPVSQPFNAMDEARLVALREAAVAAGRPAHEADRFLEAQRAGKSISFGLPDEPYVVPT
jgi:hypothetical protein